MIHCHWKITPQATLHVHTSFPYSFWFNLLRTTIRPLANTDLKTIQCSIIVIKEIFFLQEKSNVSSEFIQKL